MAQYTPDVWKVIEITDGDNPPTARVLAGWYGGYAGSNSWKLSSGITKWTEEERGYEAVNVSGSVYLCSKQAERTSMMTASMLNTWIKAAAEEGSKVKIRALDIKDGDIVTLIVDTEAPNEAV